MVPLSLLSFAKNIPSIMMERWMGVVKYIKNSIFYHSASSFLVVVRHRGIKYGSSKSFKFKMKGQNGEENG